MEDLIYWHEIISLPHKIAIARLIHLVISITKT
jgi:hypothetical protein